MRLEVKDPSGAALQAQVEMASLSNQFQRTFDTSSEGRYTAQDLPFGVYHLVISHTGFSPVSQLVEIRSSLPTSISVSLGIAPLETQVAVSDVTTLINPYLSNRIGFIGARRISEQQSAQPGRDVGDLVNSQPGWVYENNGILHPRGSEYDVQFVVDGVPLTENRSPSFAPPFDTDDVDSIKVLTAGYPAEYGRKLGGIIELTSPKDVVWGLHGRFDAQGGSFQTGSVSGSLVYGKGKNRYSLSGNGFHTDRYLDPPVVENFSNRSNQVGYSGSYERDLTSKDRIRFTASHDTVRFLTPSNLEQQEIGQRQDLVNEETGGQVQYQHVISSNLLLSVQGSVRDARFGVSSNQVSTPLIVFQDRGYREGYGRADLAGHRGQHDWKIGVDGIFSHVHEALNYKITDPSEFDPGTLQQFQFRETKWDMEPSFWAQDQFRWRNWNIAAGLRFDHYKFVIRQSAWSPRIGVSRYFPALDMLVHASYDRVFQTPAMENLLLSSSPELSTVAPNVLRIPVEPAHANYFEIGTTSSFFGKLRLDVNVFRRNARNLADDDTLLNTGVSFPITFAVGRIIGEEVRIDVPNWGRFSGYISYSNQSATAWGPITGGLFLGQEANEGLIDTSKFAVGSDQRNTLRSRIRLQASKRFWFAFGASYGSGLPVEIESEGIDRHALEEQYGPRVVEQVNFDRGRVRPNYSLDASAAAQLWRTEKQDVALQVELSNLTDHVNVVNFASLLSGTGISTSRSASARVRWTF